MTAATERTGAIYPQPSEEPSIEEYAIDLRKTVTHCRLVVNGGEILVSADDQGAMVMVLSPGKVKHQMAEPRMMGEYVRVTGLRIHHRAEA